LLLYIDYSYVNMRQQNTSDNKITTRRLFLKYLNPFSKERVTLFDVVAKGDTDKEKKLLLLILRIVHILCLVTIPAAITGLVYILSSRNFVPENTAQEVTVMGTVFFYLISFIMVLIGYRNLKISRWFAKYFNKMHLMELLSPPEYYDYFAVMMTHIFRIIMFFEMVVLISFAVGMINDNIYVALPLFVLATVVLILTYPTNGRLDEYLSKQKISNEFRM
jgi:hypothetical protein